MLVFGWWALLVLVLLASGLVGLTAFRYGLLPTLFGGAPYMPTNEHLVQVMLKLADVQSNDRVVDLGSGDGRLVIAAAKQGAQQATGYEIDSWNVRQARRLAKQQNLLNVQFKNESFWKAPLGDITVVFIYGLPPYMARFAEKCRTELPPDARIVSLLYELPGLTAMKTEEGVYLYQL